MQSLWGKSLKAALVFTVVFAFCGFLALASLGGGPPGPAETRIRNWGVPVTGVSGLITALVIWRAIAARAATARLIRGLISGVACGVLVHPVCWSLVSLANVLASLLGISAGSALGEPPLSVAHEITAVVKFSILSLIFFGWLTVIAGAITGMLLAIWQDDARYRG
jgi:hypothetical protein